MVGSRCWFWKGRASLGSRRDTGRENIYLRSWVASVVGVLGVAVRKVTELGAGKTDD